LAAKAVPDIVSVLLDLGIRLHADAGAATTNIPATRYWRWESSVAAWDPTDPATIKAAILS